MVQRSENSAGKYDNAQERSRDTTWLTGCVSVREDFVALFEGLRPLMGKTYEEYGTEELGAQFLKRYEQELLDPINKTREPTAKWYCIYAQKPANWKQDDIYVTPSSVIRILTVLTFIRTHAIHLQHTYTCNIYANTYYTSTHSSLHKHLHPIHIQQKYGNLKNDVSTKLCFHTNHPPRSSYLSLYSVAKEKKAICIQTFCLLII